MVRSRSKQIFQQFLIAVVVLSLICPGSLWAKKEKAGKEIIVTKEDGLQVKGELLKVEDNSLLLLIHESLAKVSIIVSEIDNIKVKKKSMAKNGAIIGALVGCFFGGYLVYSIFNSLDEEQSIRYIIIGAAIGGGLGAAPGLIVGGLADGIAPNRYKTYQVKGKSPSEIKEILKKLKKKARFKK